MLTDALGVELHVGDQVATLTGGRNPSVLVGTVMRIHDVKVSVDITEARFVGEPVSMYPARRLPRVGDTRQLNAYRLFRIGPCVHDQAIDVVELKWTDLYFETWKSGSVHVKMTHKPTGLTGEGDDPENTLEAKAVALKDLTRKVVEHERKEREKGH